MGTIITIILYLVSLLIGSFTLWLVGKIFQKPLSFKYLVLGAFFTEVPKYISLLLELPNEIINIARLLITWIVLIKIASMKTRNAFLGAILYVFVRIVIAVILGFILTTFAIKFYF